MTSTELSAHERADMTGEAVVVSLSELHPFPNHPFKVTHDEAMDSLADSIQKNGLINRIIIRPRAGGGYEIIAGHRRVEASRMLGFSTIAADLRRDMTDDAAVIAMVETNLRQRPKLLPSERAWAYRMMRDALLHRGERNDLKGVERKKTRDEIAEIYGENPRQVNRYIRLTHLSENLLSMVDEGKLPLGRAVAISFLGAEAQGWIEEYYRLEGSWPNSSQISEMRRLSAKGELSQEAFEDLMLEITPVKQDSDSFFSGLREEYFPGFTDEDIQEKLRELVEEFFHRRRMEY